MILLNILYSLINISGLKFFLNGNKYCITYILPNFLSQSTYYDFLALTIRRIEVNRTNAETWLHKVSKNVTYFIQ